MTRKRCFALGCALLLAAFIKPVFAQQLSESEQVLAGLKRISKSADYPAELTIPDPWIAACLELTTPDAIQQSSEAALAAYQALLSKRATMDAEGFKREETRLRRAVDSVSTGGQGHARTWKVGAMQGGKQQSVLIERNGVKCAGAVLGSVHTHPEKISIESLSDRDFTNHIAEHRSVSIVLYSDRMCALVTAHEPADSRRATVLPRFTATWVAYSPWRIEGLHDAVIRHGAHMAEMFGSAYYCGALGSRLNRMTPAEVDPENPVLVLAAKAWVVSMKNRAPGKWSAIDFPYTPEIDPGFKAYLERNFGSTKARWALEGTRQNLFEQIILEMYPDGGYATGGTYIAIPDQRDESNLPYSIYFKCNPLGAAPHAGKLNCGATYGLRGEKLRMAEVDYSEANGIGTALDLDGRTPGKYWSIEVNTKTAVTTQGEVIVHDGTNAFFEITGKGSMQTPEVLYEGQMVHGKPDGSGKVRLSRRRSLVLRHRQGWRYHKRKPVEMKRLIHALVALSLCSPLWARAEVDLTKLTYWHEWVMTRTDWGDLVQTYQGNSSYDGMFGLGWCAAMHVSDPKLRLSGFHVDLEQWLSLRGQAIVNNRCGTASQKGREIMFLPTYATKKMLRDMSVADYVKQMKDDETLEFIQVGVKAESASLKLSRTGMRIFPVGRPEMGFSTDGVLQVIAATTIVRDARGRISGLREGNTDTIRFAYGEDNHVKSFRTDQDYQGTFKYDANGRQVEHENAWKKTYLFDFDPAGRLQSVHWPDGTQVTMFYLGNTSKIASFLERDGSMETYRIIEGDTSTERRVLAARMKDGVKIHEFDAQYWFTENGDLKQARVRQRTKDSEWTALDETYSLQTN